MLATLAATGCDDGTGVVELIKHTKADGTELPPFAGCTLMVDDNSFSGSGLASRDYAIEAFTDGETVHYRYFIAKEEDVGMDFVLPDTGELAAEIEANREFFESDEVKTVSFETYDGQTLEVFLWGQDDCEGELPTEPPPTE